MAEKEKAETEASYTKELLVEKKGEAEAEAILIEKCLVVERGKAATKTRLLQEKSAPNLALLQKQAETVKNNEENTKEEQRREFSLRMKDNEIEIDKYTHQLEYDMWLRLLKFD